MEILRECEIVGRTIETYPTIPSNAGSKTYGRCTLTLGRQIQKHNIAEKVELRFQLNDFLKLQRTSNRPSGKKPITWVLLGGTLGNVNELHFFQSINGPSKVGDFLVVGVDTIEESESNEEFELRMRKQYDSKETQSLLLSPMFRGRDYGTAVEANLRLHFPKKSEEDKYSSVPRSKSIAFYHETVIITTSTRYLMSEFTKFVNELGWRVVHSTKPSPESSFNQLLLERVN